MGYIKPATQCAAFIADSDASDRVKLGADYVADGHDDDVAIQEAIDALPAYADNAGYGGGLIRLSGGRFVIESSIEVRGKCKIQGEGITSTELYLGDGAETDVLSFDNTHTDAELFFHLCDLSVHGNASNNSVGSGFVCANENLWDTRIERVWFRMCRGHGLETHQTWGWKILDVLIEACYSEGLHIDESAVLGAGGSGYGVVANCKIIQGHHHGLSVVKSNDLKVYGNTLGTNANGRYAAYISACNKLLYSGNVMYNGADGHGMRLAASHRPRLIGNVINGGGAAKNALRIDADSPHAHIDGNTFGTGLITDSCETTMWGQNYREIGGMIRPRTVVIMQNTQGSGMVIGDVVVIAGVVDVDEVTHTTTGGDDKVYGVVVDDTIADDAFGAILTEGECAVVKVNGTDDIAVGDFLSTYTTAGIAKKAAAGDMAFAIAREVYTTNDSAGEIKALLIAPRKVGTVV